MDRQRVETDHLIASLQPAEKVQHRPLGEVAHRILDGLARSHGDDHIVGTAIIAVFIDEGL